MYGYLYLPARTLHLHVLCVEQLTGRKHTHTAICHSNGKIDNCTLKQCTAEVPLDLEGMATL